MKKITLVLMFSLFATNYLLAQAWVAQNSNTTNVLYAINFVDDNTGFAVGVGGTIVKTSNGGTNWDTLSSGVTVVLADVKFINVDTGYVIGRQGVILKTTNGGTNWNLLSPGTTEDFSHLFIIDSCIYASTYLGNVLKSTDGGLTWTSHYSGTSSALYGVFFTDVNTGYVIGIGGYIFKTTDGGITWNAQISGTVLLLTNLWFTDANTGYIAGFDSGADSCIILKTINGGTTWTTSHSYTNCVFNTIKFLDSNVGYLSGGNIAANSSIMLKTNDAGATWIPQPSNSYRQVYCTFPSYNVGYSCGANGTILKTSNIYLGTNGVNGFVYNDGNANCTKDSTDAGLLNIPIKMYDSGNNLRGITYSSANGSYQLFDTTGTYTIKVDTATIPYMGQCSGQGTDSILTLTSANPIANDVNFALTCKPGFDVGVQSIMVNGMIFPGWQYGFRIVAGDLNQWHNLHCASGISGQVQITVAGPQTYDGIIPGSLTPTVAGNVFTYNITNFDSVNIATSFGLLFHTDTTAQIGDTICITVHVTPTVGDNDTINNTYQYCYNVLNSLDPNYKETYPQYVSPGYNDYFTYSIHFQNTGTAPAYNIALRDTLDNNLDFSTFQVMNYSHPNISSLNGNKLSFHFNGISLPDSTSNPAGSTGFVQYRIKPRANLPAGTQIHNTAYIYFDYNSAVITNTSINEYLLATGIDKNTTESFSVFPNPSTGKYTVKLSDETNITSAVINVYNILGESIISTKVKNRLTQIDLTNQSKGLYFINVKTDKSTITQKIILSE